MSDVQPGLQQGPYSKLIFKARRGKVHTPAGLLPKHKNREAHDKKTQPSRIEATPPNPSPGLLSPIARPYSSLATSGPPTMSVIRQRLKLWILQRFQEGYMDQFRSVLEPFVWFFFPSFISMCFHQVFLVFSSQVLFKVFQNTCLIFSNTHVNISLKCHVHLFEWYEIIF